MTYIDISVPLSKHTIVWQGDSNFKLKRISKIKPSNPSTFNLTKLVMGSHMGTHVDAQLHFVHKGADVASLELEALNGPARVVDLQGAGLAIGPRELAEDSIIFVEQALSRPPGHSSV